MAANEDQIKFWNEQAGLNWVELQETMDRNLSAILTAIMAFAAPKPGECVLDIGCGTGVSCLALADAVGSGGAVTGIDVSAPMLALARERAKSRANIAFIEANASSRVFKPEFDLLFSRFGVMFFDDPPAAFANLRRALKPGGRLAFVCWRALAENPWAATPIAAARPFLPEVAPTDPLAPGPFAFADAERLKAILAASGFSAIRIERQDGVMDMGRDLDDAAAQSLRIGPLSRLTAEADEAARTKIVAAVRAALARFTVPDGGIALPAACWLVGARA